MSCIGQQHILARLQPAQASIAWCCACCVIWREGTRTQLSVLRRVCVQYTGGSVGGLLWARSICTQALAVRRLGRTISGLLRAHASSIAHASSNNVSIITHYYICYYLIITHYYICYYIIITYYYQVIITYYYSNNNPLLLIITRSIIGNNGSIITYY